MATSVGEATKLWAESVDFSSASVRRLAVARTKAPTTGPESVQRAFALYSTWDARDLGTTRLLRVPLEGNTAWAIHTSTDGDDGFLELFDASGKLLRTGVTGVESDGDGFKPKITWDAKVGTVRERVAPKDASPEIIKFHREIDDAKKARSPLGKKISVGEAKEASKVLVGTDLTTASVDGYEAAALRRTSLEAPKLTHGARNFISALGDLYADGTNKTLRGLQKPDATQLLGAAPIADRVSLVTAEVAGRRTGAKAGAFLSLTRKAWELLPTQLTPATRSEAKQSLISAGATSAQANRILESLASSGSDWFLGKVFQQGEDWNPKEMGLAVFASTDDGKKIAAAMIRTESTVTPAAVDARTTIKNLTGADREVQVLSTTNESGGTVSNLRWAPPTGGEIRAKLNAPTDGEPEISGLALSPVLEPALAATLTQHLAASGGPTQILGWVGHDGPDGPAFIAAHRPQNASPTLSRIQIHLGGSATVSPFVLQGSDQDLARALALVLSRAHAEAMVQDPGIPDAARLEVALRTRWASTADLTPTDPAESPVGFDAAHDAFQFMLGGVWGDNAVFTTLGKDGSVRVEDMN